MPGQEIIQLSLKLAPVFAKGLETSKRAFMVRYQPQLDNSYVVTDKNGSRE